MFQSPFTSMALTGGVLPLFSSHVIEVRFHHRLSIGVNIDRRQIATIRSVYSSKHPGTICLRKTEAATLGQSKNQDILKGRCPMKPQFHLPLTTYPLSRLHSEHHLVSRIGWLRAAVLGANDGIVSTASLIMGVATASAGPSQILVAGVAGLVAGAMSMAAGEYVSVSSQADTEEADLARERIELETQPEAEHEELTEIYVKRGLTAELARQVAIQLTANDALDAHSRDELGIVEHMAARPVEAALTSALTFAVGAALPLLMVVLSPASLLIYTVATASLAFLALLGAIGAKAGGANVWRATTRVTFWGAFAMALTAGIGALVGTAV